MKRSLLLLVIALSLCLALLSVFHQRVAATSGNFMTFSETDPNNHITYNSTHIDFSDYRNEDAILYNNTGIADYFTDFTHFIAFKSVTASTSRIAFFWAISNTIDDVKGLYNANITVISLERDGFTAGGSIIYLKEHVGSSTYEAPSHYSISEGTWYYFKIDKLGTALNAYIYDDSARTNLLATLSLTLQATYLFQNIIVCDTWNSGSAGFSGSCQIENLTMQQAPKNSAPYLDLAGASYKGSCTLLAAKQDYKFFYACKDYDGVIDISYAEIRLDYASKNVILRATRGSGDSWTFSEQSDPSNYVTLGTCTDSTSAYTKSFSFYVKINWNWDDATETLGVRVYAIDSASKTDTDDYTNIFGVENDLATANLSVSDYRCNPSQTLAFSGYLCYEGTSVTAPDDNYQVKVRLSGVQKGSTDSTLVSGLFSIGDVTAEATFSSYTYTVDATYLAANGTFSDVTVDRVQVQGYTTSDSRANVGDNVYIDVLLYYDYDDNGVSDGSVTINGYSASNQGAGLWRIIRTFSNVTSVTYNTVAVSGNTYGITTVDQNSKSATVIWDELTLSYLSANDSRVNIDSYSQIRCKIRSEYDWAYVTSGTVKVNGTSLAWDSANSWWELLSSEPTVGNYSYYVSSVSWDLYGITALNTAVSANLTYVTFDDLIIFNLQSPEYNGDGNVTYSAQIKYGFDSSIISGAYANVSKPSGANILQATSNATGWISFTLTQTTASETGSYVIFGVNDNNYGITVAGTNQTFSIYSWALNTTDTDDNILGNTTLTISKGSSDVWAGSVQTIRLPSDTFNVTVLWLEALQVNVTINSQLLANTATNFTCQVYPFTITNSTYYAASNATISEANFISNILTVNFTSSPASYILVSTYTVKPTYILNVTYDLSTCFSNYLVLPHEGNTTISIAYLTSWVGVYIPKATRIMTSADWITTKRLNITFSGSPGDTGEVEVYCSEMGAVVSTDGFSTASYSAITDTLTGTFAFSSSDKSVGLNWEASSINIPGGPSGPSGGNLVLTIHLLFPPKMQSGKSVEGTIEVDWSGPNIVYVYDVQFENQTWFQVSGLPLKLMKDRGTTQGNYSISVVVNVPSSLTGKYSSACTLTLQTESGQPFTASGNIVFDVTSGPTTIPDYMTLIMLAVIALIVLAAVFRTQTRTR